MTFIEFISTKEVQTVLSFITVLLASFSIVLTYRLTRPKIKCKIFFDKRYIGKFDAVYSNNDGVVTANIHIDFVNNSPNKTQIKNVCFKYKNHYYHAANVYTDYSSIKTKVAIARDDEKPVNENLLLAKVPFTLDSFESKNIYLTFFDLPLIESSFFTTILKIYVVGKKLPIICPMIFSKIKLHNSFPIQYIVKNETFTTAIKMNKPLKKYQQPNFKKKNPKR